MTNCRMNITFPSSSVRKCGRLCPLMLATDGNIPATKIPLRSSKSPACALNAALGLSGLPLASTWISAKYETGFVRPLHSTSGYYDV